jgi:hypothetical protein
LFLGLSFLLVISAKARSVSQANVCGSSVFKTTPG